jgi:multiple sugar transport system permease protein
MTGSAPASLFSKLPARGSSRNKLTTSIPSDLTAKPKAHRRHYVGTPSAWKFMLLPGAFILASVIYPFVQLLHMSISNIGAENIIGSWPFVGLANYRQALSTQAFWQAVETSAVFTSVILVVDLVCGFVIALWLTQPVKGTGLAQSLMVLGWALPPVVTGTAWKFLLQQNGLVNAVLRPVGGGGVGWLDTDGAALWSVAAVVAWASVPFCAVVLRAGLLGVPRDIIEAARVDGGTDLKVVTKVLLPQLKNLVVSLAILVVVYGFGGSFAYIFVLTEGGPGTVTTTLPFLGYVEAFSDFDFGVAAAIAVISMLVVLGLASGYLSATRKEGRT